MSEKRKRCINCIHHENRGNRGIWCKAHLHYVYETFAIICSFYEQGGLDESEKRFEEKVTTEMCAVVSLNRLLLYVVSLKKKAITTNDKEMYEIADNIENDLQLLIDKSTIFERW